MFLVVIAVRDFGDAPTTVAPGAMGVGTIVGRVMILSRVAKGKLAQDMVVGVLGWSVPIIALALFPSPVTAIAALVVIGVADPWVNLGLETIPQRLAPSHAISRVYAAVESIAIAAMALGSLLAPLLIHLFGTSASMVGLGVLVTAYAISTLPRLRLLGDALGIDLDLKAAALELEQHGRAAVAVLPAAVERFRHLGVGHVGEPHRHAELAAELGGEPHVLVRELQGEARRVVFVGQEPVVEPVEGALASAGAGAHGFPQGQRLDARP